MSGTMKRGAGAPSVTHPVMYDKDLEQGRAATFLSLGRAVRNGATGNRGGNQDDGAKRT
jgi:hypothetical protein